MSLLISLISCSHPSESKHTLEYTRIFVRPGVPSGTCAWRELCRRQVSSSLGAMFVQTDIWGCASVLRCAVNRCTHRVAAAAALVYFSLRRAAIVVECSCLSCRLGQALIQMPDPLRAIPVPRADEGSQRPVRVSTYRNAQRNSCSVR